MQHKIMKANFRLECYMVFLAIIVSWILVCEQLLVGLEALARSFWLTM